MKDAWKKRMLNGKELCAFCFKLLKEKARA